MEGKAKELTVSQIKTCTWGSGKMIDSTEMEFIFMLMAKGIKGNSLRERKTGGGHTITIPVQFMMASGRTTAKMASESTLIITGKSMKAIG